MCNLPHNTAQSVAQQKEKDYSKGLINPWWQGWLDSNQRMRESKSLALPLGYTPVYGLRRAHRVLPHEVELSKLTIINNDVLCRHASIDCCNEENPTSNLGYICPLIQHRLFQDC